MSESSHLVRTLEPPAVRSPQSSVQVASMPRRSWLAKLIQAMPTVTVVLALGGLAAWGHQTGWSIPKFSALLGNGGKAERDWCDKHSVPESICVECNPVLMPRRTFDWCKVHGVHECPLEHPEVAELRTTPRVTNADLERARRALEFAERPKNNSKCQLHSRRVQFASQESFDKQGIELDPVWRARVEEKISATGEIGYDQTRVASLSSPLPGKIWRVEREIGQPVKKDDVLALIDAAEVGKAKGEFLQAVAQVELRAKTVESIKPYVGAAIPEARLREAESALQEAQIRLVSSQQALANLGLPVRVEELKGLSIQEIDRRIRFLGLPTSLIASIDAQTATANLIPVRASLDGVVAARKATVGELVDPSKPLFTVADTRQMWLTLHVRLEDARQLTTGQMVRFRPDGGLPLATGPVSWISTAVDERTRMVEVRAPLANADGRLRANTFGAGEIVLRAEEQAIVVPSEAVHWEGNCHVVFVYDRQSRKEDAPKIFHVRSVRLGARDGDMTEIIAGVLPDEMIAVKNSGVIRAELLKSNLGAG